MAEGASRRLRDRLRTGTPIVAPGVWDGISARLAADAGFTTAFVSGTVASGSRGLPDMNLLTLAELVAVCESVLRGADLELLVDLDTGYGGPTMIARAVRQLSSIGVAGYQIEDQIFPRRWRPGEPTRIVDLEEMVVRIKVARAADPGLVLIARTDCLEVTDVEAAIHRAAAYAKAGADLVWVNGITTLDEAAAVAGALAPRVVYNVAGTDRAPVLSSARAQELGVAVVVYPMHAARAAAFGARRAYRSIAAGAVLTGDELISYSEYQELTGWGAWAALDEAAGDVVEGTADVAS